MARPGVGVPRWIQSGWWVVGPYPHDKDRINQERVERQPPETAPDPSRPVLGPAGHGPPAELTWRTITPDGNGSFNLADRFNKREYFSCYLLTRVFARAECPVALKFGVDDWLRLWCNGSFVHERWLLNHQNDRTLVLRLHAGWNTILARVTNGPNECVARLEFNDDLPSLARAGGDELDRRGLTDDLVASFADLAAEALRTCDPRAPRGALDHEIVRRDDLYARIVKLRPADEVLALARARAFEPARPGSILRFNLVLADKDEAAGDIEHYGQLWYTDGSETAWLDGDGGWPVDLRLAWPLDYELISGPPGVTVDPGTGILTWTRPEEPRASEVKVHLRDAELPGLAEEATFTIFPRDIAPK